MPPTTRLTGVEVSALESLLILQKRHPELGIPPLSKIHDPVAELERVLQCISMASVERARVADRAAPTRPGQASSVEDQTVSFCFSIMAVGFGTLYIGATNPFWEALGYVSAILIAIWAFGTWKSRHQHHRYTGAIEQYLRILAGSSAVVLLGQTRASALDAFVVGMVIFVTFTLSNFTFFLECIRDHRSQTPAKPVE